MLDRYRQVVYRHQLRTGAFSAPEPLCLHKVFKFDLHSFNGRAPGPKHRLNKPIDHAQFRLSIVRMIGWLSNPGVVRSKLTVGILFKRWFMFIVNLCLKKQHVIIENTRFSNKNATSKKSGTHSTL